MKIAIVGGGIGGLAAGVAFALRGADVTVLEQAPALEEVGAGLQISPNGWRVLEAMGVAPLLAETLFEPEMIEMRDGRTGGRIFTLPMRHFARARWGAPYMQVHRADLVAALAARLHSLASDALHMGAQVTGRQGNTLTLADGTQIKADLIIAADGGRSGLRSQMLGPDDPCYTGNVAWRAVVPVADLAQHTPPNGGCIWVGDKRHAVTTRLRAGTLTNFVGMVEVPDPGPEGWRITGTAAQARADFEGWHPTITQIIDRAQVLHRWALFDRAPLSRWHDGALVLLGDAAHPMLPSMAQGAVQALEDAWVLAGCCSDHDDLDTALTRYFELRHPRTARIQAGSAANARMFHKATPLGRVAFYGPMAIGARLAPGLIHARQDWVYSHDVTAEVSPL